MRFESEPKPVDASGRLAPELFSFLREHGLIDADESPPARPLAGGVSSDIWLVETHRGPVCVKRALARLKVAQEWRAPVERNAFEVRWFRTVGAIVQKAVPRILADDAAAGVFAMDYLEPHRFRIWKNELRHGRVDLSVAEAVGETLARVHAATAGDPAVADRFPTDDLFQALRLEPYLEATARVHPDLADALLARSRSTLTAKTALVHGDVSPKNILIGPDGPVFLDAECAWYGDPAFDLAFCLNHLLLKCLWVPAVGSEYLRAFAVLAEAYRAGVAWEPPDRVEARTAHLLPGLLLARVDGKSPVEYLTDENDKNRVRRAARALLVDPVRTLEDVAAAWAWELNR